MENKGLKSWAFLWAIIDTFVNILVLTTVAVILAKTIHGILLTLIILVFVVWAFRPIYSTFKEFIRKFPKRKKKKKLSIKTTKLLYFLFYFLVFIMSILIFITSVSFLDELLHPLVLTFAIFLSSVSIIFYHHFTKKEFRGPLWSFSKFFLISTIFLFLSVLFFSAFGVNKGINLDPQKVNFEVYNVNNALSPQDILLVLNDSSKLWANYNISLFYNPISEVEVDLTEEEVDFLFNNGSSEGECYNYTNIINKITNKTNVPFLIFLDNNYGRHAGRGSLCNLTFALVSPERAWYEDFTGWNTAHEIGHALGLVDSIYYERTRKNLMNDEIKKLIFFNSDFLTQSQVDIIVNKSKQLKTIY